MTGLETAFAAAAVKETLGPAKAMIAAIGKPRYDRLIVEYCKCFQAHVDASYERCRYVKNVLYRDDSIELKTQYVNVLFKRTSESLISDSEISKRIRQNSKVLISGTAGAGKTMFMKWLTLELIDELLNHQKIPLFLELRYLTESSLDKGFISYILESTATAQNRVSLERFKIGLELGQFILVIDAVDEARPALRERLLEDIRNLIKDYPKCSILLSSRPDDELQAIQELDVYHTVDMELDQIILVIEKLQFADEVKQRLIHKLKDGLFNSHSEFLSNPLLATIMLLNFDHSADIPTKLTSFYRQAFEALYQRHDAAKGAYRRGHFAGLPLDEYEKVFAAFCFDSFLDTKVQFSDAELLDYFRAAASYCNVKSEASLLVEDAKKSVCVIQREGLDNVFAHRTFQEYFTALFLSRYREDDFIELIKDSVLGWQNNNVLKMLLEIAPEPLEQEWLEPDLKKIVELIRQADTAALDGCATIFNTFYSSFDVEVDSGQVVGFSGGSERAGNWLASIGFAYNDDHALSRKVFIAGPIFTSLSNYVDSHPSGPTVEDLSGRIISYGPSGEFDDEEEAAETIDINEHDLPWLMDSDMPTVLGIIRDDVVAFYDALCDRIQNRADALSRLRTRHFNSPVRRKKS